MQAPAILQQHPAVQSTSDSAVPVDLEARTPEEEYQAWLGEQAMWDGYFADKGVL